MENCHFSQKLTKYAAHIIPLCLDLEVSNFTRLLYSISCGAPSYFELSPLANCGVTALEKMSFFEEKGQFSGMRNSFMLRPGGLKLHMLVA